MTTFRDKTTPPRGFLLVCNTLQKTQVFRNTRTCPKSRIWRPPWTSGPQPLHFDFQIHPFTQRPWQVYKACLKATEQAALVGDVYVQPLIKPEGLAHTQYLQVLPSFPLSITRLSVESTGDPNICPVMLGCWLLHQLQILSLGARPPFHSPSHSQRGETHQISGVC